MSPVAPFIGQAGQPVACDKENIMFNWLKKVGRLFICGSYADASDHAVFPAATNKKS